MNEIVHEYLLARDKFMPNLHLRQSGFAYSGSSCGSFTQHREKIQNFEETDDLNFIYKNVLDKAFFAHDVAYADNKDLAKKTISDKMLKDRVYEIALNSQNDG